MHADRQDQQAWQPVLRMIPVQARAGAHVQVRTASWRVNAARPLLQGTLFAACDGATADAALHMAVMHSNAVLPLVAAPEGRGAHGVDAMA
jgi:hypothetical protein